MALTLKRVCGTTLERIRVVERSLLNRCWIKRGRLNLKKIKGVDRAYGFPDALGKEAMASGN